MAEISLIVSTIKVMKFIYFSYFPGKQQHFNVTMESCGNVFVGMRYFLYKKSLKKGFRTLYFPAVYKKLISVRGHIFCTNTPNILHPHNCSSEYIARELFSRQWGGGGACLINSEMLKKKFMLIQV